LSAGNRWEEFVKLILVAVGAVAIMGASEASAGEIFGGLYKHDVDLPTNKSGNVEGGMDVQLGWRGGKLAGTPLQPYVFGAVNTSGDTSYAAVGLSAKLGGALYIRPGLGLAVRTGSATKYNVPGNDKIEFGSRILFEPELAVGFQVAPRASVEASWVHMSHATLFSGQNPGIDNLGVRVSLALP
jgi:hypothetical protein